MYCIQIELPVALAPLTYHLHHRPRFAVWSLERGSKIIAFRPAAARWLAPPVSAT